ncbi:DHS-like NAD/FAD-binding domain-containing protein [Trametes gibbosa]|nr:DHS-like NAD/FAD-binding domain-containing protein [Trametes gibbosa]
MGNQVSAPHDGPPVLLKGKDIASIAKYINSSDCHRVFVMLGAGVSTAAGIPDFRSPDTGLYSNLERLNLPYPEAVFEINYFRQNPMPFYTLARELYPGRFRPTLTHTFVKLLADHHLLDTCFTQNIDTLERQAGVPGDRIVEAHGSFAAQHCIDCHASLEGSKMKRAVETGEIVKCEACGGLVKPDIVFFGESLPQVFQQKVPRLRSADLLIVIGTSLTVHPFAALTGLVPAVCPRVLINIDPAGDIGTRPDDVVLLGRCDEIVRTLCEALGWEKELDREWAKTEILRPFEELLLVTPEAEKPSAAATTRPPADLDDAGTPPPVPEVAAAVPPTVTEAEAEDARVEAELELLTEQVAKGLEISEGVESRPPTTVTTAPEPAVKEDTGKDVQALPDSSQQGADDPSSEQKEGASTAKEKL